MDVIQSIRSSYGALDMEDDAADPCLNLVVPYSRFRSDRFYDWPPDPIVSSVVSIDDYKYEGSMREIWLQRQQSLMS